MNAAKVGAPADEMLSMSNSGTLYAGDPEYECPQAGDLEIVYVAFDILYKDEESVINRSLAVRGGREDGGGGRGRKGGKGKEGMREGGEG